MATHSSILAGKIPWTEKVGRLQSMGSQRVSYDWATKRTCTHTFMDRNNWSSPGMSYFLSLHRALERVLLSVSERGFRATDACSVAARTLSIRPVCRWQNAWPAFGWDSGERLNLLLVLLLRPLWIFLLMHKICYLKQAWQRWNEPPSFHPFLRAWKVITRDRAEFPSFLSSGPRKRRLITLNRLLFFY